MKDVLENLKDPNVTEVRRFTCKVNGKIIPTNSFILRSAATRVPSVIRLGPLQAIPRTSYHKPMLCLKCAHFGHTRLKCRTLQVFNNCGVPAHGDCTAPLKCVNWKGNHRSFDKSCPSYLKEQEVIKYKINYNVSFFEARKYIEFQLHK